MNLSAEYIKVGLIGITINGLLNFFAYSVKGIGFGEFFPCYLFWIGFLLIGLLQKFGKVQIMPE